MKNSREGSFGFFECTKEKVVSQTYPREGETKLGEKVATFDDLADFKGKYVVLGISEDIGPRANVGFGGADKAFDAFFKRFLNVQSNRFLSGESVCMLGQIKTTVDFTTIRDARVIIEELDDFVTEILTPCIEAGAIPIVIGGGHNNAFPIIRAWSQVHKKTLNVVNCDPHADFRALEGRHSGNAFSYAFDQGFLKLYGVLGLHQSYNSEYILDALEKNSMLYSFWDDYLAGREDFNNDLKSFFDKFQQQPYGVELDMDCIADMPSSAVSPSGLTLEEARRYVLKMAGSKQVSYLHLPEAAPKTEIEETHAGKALVYLVTDFIKSNSQAVPLG
jgi:formiminoglutamase